MIRASSYNILVLAYAVDKKAHIFWKNLAVFSADSAAKRDLSNSLR